MIKHKKLFKDKELQEEFHKEWYQVFYLHFKQKFFKKFNVIKEKYENLLEFLAYYLKDEIICLI